MAHRNPIPLTLAVLSFLSIPLAHLGCNPDDNGSNDTCLTCDPDADDNPPDADDNKPDADDSQPPVYVHSELPPGGLIASIPPALYEQGSATSETVVINRQAIEEMKFLGPTLLKDANGKIQGVNFSLFSSRATQIRLLLFENPESDTPTREFEMTRLPDTDLWNAFIEGADLGLHYGYVAWGPNWTYETAWQPGTTHGFKSDVDDQGNRFNPNKLLQDPYCKAVHRDFDWSKGNPATGQHRAVLSYGAAGKCLIVESQYEWSEAEATWRAQRKAGTLAGHGDNELIIYEAHPKGFTANSTSGVQHPGTFRGFGEKAAYLKELGITAVEMMPPFEMPSDAGYWGYDTLSFFIPENTYAAKRSREEIIDEFKWMVDQLHQHGIEVIIDVVFNHSGEGGVWREKIDGSDGEVWMHDHEDTANLLSFRGLDNDAYYALNPSNKSEYRNYTGMGQTLRTNNAPVKRLILDALRYWAEEFHVDGFRFDLAPVLGAVDGKYDDQLTTDFRPAETLVQEIANDPVLQRNNTRLIAEPWDVGHYAIGQFTKATVDSAGNGALSKGFGWSEWNAPFRDWWRSFVNEDNRPLDEPVYSFVGGGDTLTGSASLFGEQGDGRRPFHSINYVTVHDGMTLYDLVTYPQKLNGCGLLNPICCIAPDSLSCYWSKDSGEDHNRSRNWGDEGTKRQMMRNFFTALLVSHGTPHLLGGDEWMRTQFGNNNAFMIEADNIYNWHDWGTWAAANERQRMFDFVKKTIQLRKTHPVLAPAAYDSAFSWIGPSGAPDWRGQTVGMRYDDGGNGKALAVLINMGSDDVLYNLDGNWVRLLDTQSWFDSVSYLSSEQKSLSLSGNVELDAPASVVGSYDVKAKSIVVLEGR